MYFAVIGYKWGRGLWASDCELLRSWNVEKQLIEVVCKAKGNKELIRWFYIFLWGGYFFHFLMFWSNIPAASLGGV